MSIRARRLDLGGGGITAFLLNIGHALDHFLLLIFATAVGAIATDLGYARWEDLMPFVTGAFVMFGLGSVPAGRLGDMWGRRPMMLVFFFGAGFACILAGMARGAWQLGAALTLLGTFASIYHPVGVPMLVQDLVGAGDFGWRRWCRCIAHCSVPCWRQSAMASRR